MSTLSVETSSSGSSTSTVSPSAFSQRVTVPSVTDSPRAGSSTGVASPAGAAGAAAGAAGAAAGAAGASAAGAGAATGAGAASAAGAAAAAGAPEPSSMIASSAPTSTVSSSPTLIEERMPEAGAGISVSTLSVDTSSSGSSTSTRSPSAFSQRVTVPSETLSPSAGSVTETAMVSATPIKSCVREVLETGGGGRDQSCACSGLPASARCASPRASDWVGWAWMSCATSAGRASQL